MYQELIKKAHSVAKEKELTKICLVGGVGSALITDKDNIYVGSSIDCACGLGLCGEHSAIASMVTNGESKIKTIVAVGTDGTPLPPCGRCRELMYEINFENLDCDVIIGFDKILKLKELLPEPWFKG